MKVICIVLLFAAVYAKDDCEYYRKLDQIVQEPDCSAEGGICTFGADCAELRGGPGLCPTQQKKGVECCAGVSSRDKRCRKHGGECRSDYCNPSIVYDDALDCGHNEKCCVLV